MISKTVASGGPIDAGRFVELLRNTLHTAEGNDHHERKPEPDVGDDTRLKRTQGLRQAN